MREPAVEALHIVNTRDRGAGRETRAGSAQETVEQVSTFDSVLGAVLSMLDYECMLLARAHGLVSASVLWSHTHPCLLLNAAMRNAWFVPATCVARDCANSTYLMVRCCVAYPPVAELFPTAGFK